ncbi:MAG TPA: alpha/beta hydrolase [Acidimicrobiales bacterium]|nr:alpha/beta hydrolase [Acidimicrobiales bacterium]
MSVGGGVELHVEGWPPQVCPHPVGFVLVHGLASNAAMWRDVAERLKAMGHAVVAVDQRGHGRSSKPSGGYELSTFVADLVELLGQLPIRRPALAGQSFGGNVVIQLAARQPDLVAGVACVDGGWIELSDHFASWEACRSALAPPIFEGKPYDEIEKLLRSGHADWPESAIEGLLANFEVRADRTVAPWLTRPRHIEILRSLWEHHPSKLYPSVPVPVLLVPAVDPSHPKAWGSDVDRAAELLPVARLHPMVGHHDLHAQHPEAMTDLLHEWADSSLC